MSTDLLTTHDLPALREGMPLVHKSYTLKLSRQEVYFLTWFIPWMLETCDDPELILELCTAAEFGRRFRDRLLEPKDCQMTLRASEMIALKRVLYAPPLPAQWDIDRNSLMAQIDPLTMGII